MEFQDTINELGPDAGHVVITNYDELGGDHLELDKGREGKILHVKF